MGVELDYKAAAGGQQESNVGFLEHLDGPLPCVDARYISVTTAIRGHRTCEIRVFSPKTHVLLRETINKRSALQQQPLTFN
jgi:hypothetical protein